MSWVKKYDNFTGIIQIICAMYWSQNIKNKYKQNVCILLCEEIINMQKGQAGKVKARFYEYESPPLAFLLLDCSPSKQTDKQHDN